MSLDPSMPVEYLVGHLEEALARDSRVAEQGLTVHVAGTPLSVTVAGTMVAAADEASIAAVVGELLPGVPVRVQARRAEYPEAPDVEEVG